MAAAGGPRSDFVKKIPDEVLQEKVAKEGLTPEEAASMMLVSKEAHRIFGDETIWKRFAEDLHIKSEHKWRENVVEFYGRATKVALDLLPDCPRSRHKDVFEQATLIKEHLEKLDFAKLKEFIKKMIEQAQAAKTPGVLKIFFTTNDEVVQAFGQFLVDSVMAGNWDAIRFCLDAGIPVDTGGREGMTALMMAAYYGNDNVVFNLILSGARVNAGNEQGVTPLMYAACSRLSTDTVVVQTLLANGASITAKDKDKRTALIVAAEFDRRDIVDILLKAGADIDERDKKGQTALMRAVDCSAIGTVQMLLENHAGVNLSDKRANTALSLAEKLKNNDPYKKEIIRLLREHGAVDNR